MKKLKEKLKGSFIRNVAMLTGGTAFAQILNITLLPVITRIYSAEQYGILSVYAAVLSVIGFLGSLNYEMAIPIAKNDKQAVNILTLSIITLFTFTSLILLIFSTMGDPILNLLNGENLIEYKLLIPLGFFFLGLYNIFTQWSFRRKDFKVITLTKFTQALSQNSINIIAGTLGMGSIGLVLGKILGQSAGVTALSKPLVKQDYNLLKYIKKRKILWAIKRYKNFPFYTTPRRLLGDITIALPVLFITSQYGSQVVGFFGLANSVIQLPMNLIGTSVSNVFYAESASLKYKDPEKVKKLSNNLLKNLIIIGIFPLVILIFLGPNLFSFVFGSDWREAGIYASLLSMVVFSRLIFKPVSNIFDIYEKQKIALILNVVRVMLVLLVFGLAICFSINSYWTVGFYSFVMSLIYFIQYLLAQKILKQEIAVFYKKN